MIDLTVKGKQMDIVTRYYIGRAILLALLLAAGCWVWSHQAEIGDGMTGAVKKATMDENTKIQREQEMLRDEGKH